jgi:hypothetical protein
MCGLCGILGGRGHWTETATNPEVFAARETTPTSRRERQARTALVNRVLKHYGLSLKDWSGASYVLKGATGKTAIVENLSQMWAEAETLTGQDLDPLDDDLVRSLRP